MATYGAVAVTTAAAILVVPANGALASANDIAGVLIQNRGPNSIWVGNDINVSATTGIEVASGQSLRYTRTPPGGVYARAGTADQASPLDTRWLGEPR